MMSHLIENHTHKRRLAAAAICVFEQKYLIPLGLGSGGNMEVEVEAVIFPPLYHF